METIEGIEYLTVAEVAQARGAKPDTVRNALDRGTLTGTKLLGRWLIKPVDAQEWTPGGWGGVDRFKKGGGA